MNKGTLQYKQNNKNMKVIEEALQYFENLRLTEDEKEEIVNDLTYEQQKEQRLELH